MIIQTNVMSFLCCLNGGLGDRDVIVSVWHITFALEGAMSRKGVATFETTLVVPKYGPFSIGEVGQVRAFSIWGGCGRCRMVRGVSEMIIPDVLQISLGIRSGLKFSDGILAV